MTINIPSLTEEQNHKFNELLEAYGQGVYWQNEGWTDSHAAARQEAEQALQEFFTQVFP